MFLLILKVILAIYILSCIACYFVIRQEFKEYGVIPDWEDIGIMIYPLVNTILIFLTIFEWLYSKKLIKNLPSKIFLLNRSKKK